MLAPDDSHKLVGNAELLSHRPNRSALLDSLHCPAVSGSNVDDLAGGHGQQQSTELPGESLGFGIPEQRMQPMSWTDDMGHVQGPMFTRLRKTQRVLTTDDIGNGLHSLRQWDLVRIWEHLPPPSAYETH